MRNPWAREYAKTPNRYIWGKTPSRFAHELIAFVPPGGRILDLGCGEGRDSVYFASCGFEVTGLDISDAGLEKAERLADERGVTVRWLCRSMLDVPVTGRFDLVYSCGAIHHVPRDDRPRLFKRLKALTRGRGLNAHLVFTDLRVYVEKDEEIDYFSAGELAEPYADWLIIRHEDGMVPCAQDGV
ncbi:MAG TPA: class I SAM-dependent methyltransferase, partial [Verrucomicrobiae bacterium]|nr:class I SAM-dependent methyltransferase [Verrucomicrobiae bacterium]